VAFELIVVGASLGGLHALEHIFAALPSSLTVPLAVVQHRHRDSDDTLRTVLQRACPFPIYEAEDKQRIEPGTIYLAPADYHLLVERGSFALSTEGPVMHARPSIDVLFDSAADAYEDRLLGLILTGASADGAQGLASVKARGGCTIVQEPSSAECPVMPSAALAATAVDHVVPLPAIVPLLTKLCQSSWKVGL
jgi:two-component system, chemotaxis family, protein-glutamate methylesterase/glutaminase